MSRRSERVSEQVRAELARLLRVEVTDPRIGLVVLHRVDVSPDLRNARVFWSALSVAAPGASGAAAPEAQVQAGLDSAASFLRRRLAHLLPLRRVPELRFQHDPSVALGARTLAQLKTLNTGDDGGGGER